MKISVIGAGYVGLVTGACFADHGNEVLCVDNNPNKLVALRQGKVPFFEPGLDDLVKRNLKEGRLHFSEKIADVVKDCRVHFICVGTPYNEEMQTLDTRIVEAAAVEVAKLAKNDDIIVVKSTSPVGTAARVRRQIAEATKTRLQVVSNPEFLKEGNAVEDFMKPDRVVIGVEDEQSDATKLMLELYAPFVRTGNPILCMDNNSAEMVKMASNGYLATRISYINEIANLCEASGANVSKVRQGMGLDSRIGHRYLFPGLGYGGSCFPKDIQALMHLGEKQNTKAPILRAVHEVNQNQRHIYFEKVRRFFGGKLSGKRFAIWGLAFKPNTDDVRDAPSLDIIAALLKEGASVQAYDPEGMNNVRKQFGDKVTFCENNYDCLKGADALCILTEWTVFRNPDFDKIKSMLTTPVIFDGRNLFNPQDLTKMGIKYFYVGQPYGGLARPNLL
jgi:UDPglucose 6-dehydrogenase